MTRKKIHLIGICGIAMGSLACMLQELGHDVQGSDTGIYPPMSDLLNDKGISIFDGFNERNLQEVDLVIIGNAISRGNVEVEYVLNTRIPYLSMAQALYQFFLKNKEVIVVSGTHGKSTTAALLAHIFESAGLSPSFFIGGVLNNYNSNYKIGNSHYFIIEGDEYDSAFFEKIPKFIFYRPKHCIVTSLEFDHADIYQSIDEIELWFKRLVNLIPSHGYILWSKEYKNLEAIMDKSLSNTLSYGTDDSDYTFTINGFNGSSTMLDIESKIKSISTESTLLGKYNYQNITAAVAMAGLLGIDSKKISEGIASFQGVKRRLDLIYSNNYVSVYEDFAHHPTSIKSMLSTIKERYPDSTCWAIYEPRSATSRRNIFQNILPEAFQWADIIALRKPPMVAKIPPKERLDVVKLCQDINSLKENAPSAYVFEDGDEIVNFVNDTINKDSHNVIVIISNGGFDGIYGKMTAMLDSIFS